MSNIKTPAKAWTQPKLVALGLIEDVSGAKAGVKTNQAAKAKS